MYLQLRLLFIPRSRLRLVVIVLAATLLATQAAHAVGLRIADAYVPAQYVDLDGDGQREMFSATMTIYDDGTSDGLVLLGDDLRLDLERGHSACVEGRAVAEAQGLLYQIENGDLTKIGFATATVQSADGGGYGILIFDTTSSMNTTHATVSGTLNFTVNPCAS